MLTDKFGREHNYLRISLTDACNMRCSYCMPLDNYSNTKKEKLMNANEIYTIAKVFVDNGIDKIRLTGGEPLVRKEFAEIAEKLSTLHIKLAITTNGLLIDKYIEVLKRYNFTTINISLDSLNQEQFQLITRNGNFNKIMQNIELLLTHNFKVKVNMVVMKTINENAVIDFIKWTANADIEARFIEFMPFADNNWEQDKVVPYNDILEKIKLLFPIEKIENEAHGTTKNYKVKGYKGSFGFITTVTEPFCESCNRLRLTADGKMKNCLFAQGETDLLTPLRNGEDILPLIKDNILNKKTQLGGREKLNAGNNRSMIKDRRVIEP